MRVSVGVAIIVFVCSAMMARAQSLQEQEMCAKQARNAFQYWKDIDKDKSDAKALLDATIAEEYQSHFNTKLRRCFVRIQTLMNVGDIYVVLMDAYEHRYYAAYYWNGGKLSGQRLCELTPTFQEKTNCSSQDEFDAFVTKYMQE
jgi:hypothetical protein